MSSQLASCRDALRLANSSCESLELRLEETERENTELKVMSSKSKLTIAIKTKIINDLQNRLETLQQELTLNKSTAQESEGTDGLNNEAHTSLSGKSQNGLNHDQLLKEHEDIVEDFSVKLQNTAYQKTKLQQLLDKTTIENGKLTEMLDKTEIENLELHNRIKTLEEKLLFGDRSEPITPISPSSPSNNSPTKQSFFTNCDTFTNGSKGITLFGEIQKDYGTLQDKFDSLVACCQCDCSIPYKGNRGREKDTNETVQRDSSLRDLFQEVYATLKQTTIVADRLINRHKVPTKS